MRSLLSPALSCRGQRLKCVCVSDSSEPVPNTLTGRPFSPGSPFGPGSPCRETAYSHPCCLTITLIIITALSERKRERKNRKLKILRKKRKEKKRKEYKKRKIMKKKERKKETKY